jgi:glucose dehydrogenase
MNHHDYGTHRFSALDAIKKANVKNLRLAFAAAPQRHASHRKW